VSSYLGCHIVVLFFIHFETEDGHANAKAQEAIDYLEVFHQAKR
jgi:hypothetical protein